MYHFDLICWISPPSPKMIANDGCSLKAAQMLSIHRAAKLLELFMLTEDLATADFCCWKAARENSRSACKHLLGVEDSPSIQGTLKAGAVNTVEGSVLATVKYPVLRPILSIHCYSSSFSATESCQSRTFPVGISPQEPPYLFDGVNRLQCLSSK